MQRMTDGLTLSLSLSRCGGVVGRSKKHGTREQRLLLSDWTPTPASTTSKTTPKKDDDEEEDGDRRLAAVSADDDCCFIDGGLLGLLDSLG